MKRADITTASAIQDANQDLNDNGHAEVAPGDLTLILAGLQTMRDPQRVKIIR